MGGALDDIRGLVKGDRVRVGREQEGQMLVSSGAGDT